MRAKLLESDSNENGDTMDDFEEYRSTTPTPSFAQNGTAPSITCRAVSVHASATVIIHTSDTGVNYK